jgi:hypothetical protein
MPAATGNGKRAVLGQELPSRLHGFDVRCTPESAQLAATPKSASAKTGSDTLDRVPVLGLPEDVTKIGGFNLRKRLLSLRSQPF